MSSRLVELTPVERLDRWRLQLDMVVKPGRPAAIRWIVWQFLLKEEQKAERKAAREPMRKAKRSVRR